MRQVIDDIDVQYHPNPQRPEKPLTIILGPIAVSLNLGEAEKLQSRLDDAMHTAYSHLKPRPCDCGGRATFKYDGAFTYVRCSKCLKRTEPYLGVGSCILAWDAMNSTPVKEDRI